MKKSSELIRLRNDCDRLFSLAVRKRDGFTCQKCGVENKNVHCAHIFSRRNLRLRFEMLNAVTLCYYCHIFWSHREPLEFAAWIQEYLGEKKWRQLETLRLSGTSKSSVLFYKAIKQLLEAMQ